MAIDPVGALLRWLNTIDPPGAALLCCAHAELPPVPGGEIGVRLAGCVAETGIDLPAQLLAAGIPRLGIVDCPQRPDDAEARVQEWSRVLDGVESPPPVPKRRIRRRGPVFDLSAPTVPRRLALGLGVPLRLPIDPGLPERDRALAALRVLAEQGRARLPEAAGEPGSPAAVALTVTGCTACGVCVRACPHDALELRLDQGVSTLSHRRDACLGDLDCVRLCPEQAISEAGALTLLDVAQHGSVELAAVATARCARCGAQHPAAEGEYCPTCSFRVAGAFGSRLPPHRVGRTGAGR